MESRKWPGPALKGRIGCCRLLYLPKFSFFTFHSSFFCVFIQKSYFCASKNRKMTGNRTFTMIKPDAVADGNIGNILAMINNAGFRIVAMKYTRLSQDLAGKFYAVHSERPFYGELRDYMSSGPIVAAVLEKDNAVEDFRKLIGATTIFSATKGFTKNSRSANNTCPVRLGSGKELG